MADETRDAVPGPVQPATALEPRRRKTPADYGSTTPIPGRCGAKLRNSERLHGSPRFCKRAPMSGRPRCRIHGGPTPTGADNPSFKHGMHSKYAYLSPRVADALSAALRDEQLLDTTEDVAFLEVLRRDAAASWDAGASAEAWQALRPLVRALREAQTDEARQAALQQLDVHVARGDQWGAAERLAQAIERKQRAVVAHQRMMVETEELIPAKRVALVMAGIARLVREFLTDDAQRREFTRRFIGFVGPRLRPGGLAGGDGPGDAAADRGDG